MLQLFLCAMRILPFIFFFLFFIPDCRAQSDSAVPIPVDTAAPVSVPPVTVQRDPSIKTAPAQNLRNDSVSRRPRTDTGWRIQNNWTDLAAITGEIFSHHPWMGFTARPETNYSARRIFHGKEIYFYIIIALLLLFAILRNAFSKYFNDLFRVFFRTTLKQRQIREQLMQSPLPSLLMNAFFVLSGGLYMALVLDHYGKNPAASVWELALYCSAGIAAAYFVKFIGLRILGSIFGIGQAVTSYIFIVFIINKMVGILVLPFIVLLAFTTGSLQQGALTLSFILLIGMLIYRFILTFAAIRNQIKVNPFHFLIYVGAFEVAPLILVYRALLLYFPEMA
jgi:hypothetical protein